MEGGARIAYEELYAFFLSFDNGIYVLYKCNLFTNQEIGQGRTLRPLLRLPESYITPVNFNLQLQHISGDGKLLRAYEHLYKAERWLMQNPGDEIGRDIMISHWHVIALHFEFYNESVKAVGSDGILTIFEECNILHRLWKHCTLRFIVSARDAQLITHQSRHCHTLDEYKEFILLMQQFKSVQLLESPDVPDFSELGGYMHR
jgi:hypothetical protein